MNRRTLIPPKIVYTLNDINFLTKQPKSLPKPRQCKNCEKFYRKGITIGALFFCSTRCFKQYKELHEEILKLITEINKIPSVIK